MSDIANHIAVSGRVDIEDLDWAACKAAGLEPIEIENLKFFADIESQTVYYFLEVAPLKVARDPEILTFLTMWNYEEYFHSHAITKLLQVCGVDMADPTDRSTEVRANARFKAKVEQFAQNMMAKVFPTSFTALWMFWGALQECLTMQAYEQVINTTKNPVLAEMFKRIAKQERRHFAYYFNQARERLENERVRAEVRALHRQEVLRMPVGSGGEERGRGRGADRAHVPRRSPVRGHGLHRAPHGAAAGHAGARRVHGVGEGHPAAAPPRGGPPQRPAPPRAGSRGGGGKKKKKKKKTDRARVVVVAARGCIRPTA